MSTYVLVPVLLFVLVALAGVGVYEMLARYAYPPAKIASLAEPAQQSKVRSRTHEGKLAVPLLAAVTEVLERFMPAARAETEACRERLARAGVMLQPETWRSLRVLSAVCGAVCAGFLVAVGGPLPLVAQAASWAVGMFVGWKLPELVLASKQKQRRCAIEASLPDVMELLGIALAAGSPIEQCFREVAASVEGPLSEELRLVDQEVNLLGHAREQALEHLAKRCCSQEVTAFVAQLVQAINQGSSVAEGLAAQAAIARETAQAEALERIRKMPTKLDIVLSMCFLPPTVALVVVPTVVNLLHFLNDTMA